MKPMMRELVVIAKDKVGLLADVTDTLANKSVNIENVSASVLEGNAIIRLTLDSEKDAKRELEAAGYKVITSDLLVVRVVNKPGEISRIARTLADAGVNIENVHLLLKGDKEALCALKVDKPQKALELLKNFATGNE